MNNEKLTLPSLTGEQVRKAPHIPLKVGGNK